MLELTTRDYFSVLGLALVLLAAFLVVRSRRRKNKKFRSFLLGRILAAKTMEGDSMEFASRSDALKYAKVKVYEFRFRYAAANGYGFMVSISRTCNKLVNELCESGVIPESVHSAWR